jgi:hypothetical protein
MIGGEHPRRAGTRRRGKHKLPVGSLNHRSTSAKAGPGDIGALAAQHAKAKCVLCNTDSKRLAFSSQTLADDGSLVSTGICVRCCSEYGGDYVAAVMLKELERQLRGTS